MDECRHEWCPCKSGSPCDFPIVVHRLAFVSILHILFIFRLILFQQWLLHDLPVSLIVWVVGHIFIMEGNLRERVEYEGGHRLVDYLFIVGRVPVRWFGR